MLRRSARNHEFFGGGSGETIAILTLGVQEEMLFADAGEKIAAPDDAEEETLRRASRRSPG